MRLFRCATQAEQTKIGSGGASRFK